MILNDYSFWKWYFHTMYMLHVYVTFVEHIKSEKCLINVQLFLQIWRFILTYNSFLTKKEKKILQLIALNEFSLVFFNIILGAFTWYLFYTICISLIICTVGKYFTAWTRSFLILYFWIKFSARQYFKIFDLDIFPVVSFQRLIQTICLGS